VLDMADFKDATRLAGIATIALYLDMILEPLVAILRFVDPVPGGAADLASIPWVLVLLACLVLVGRWIYRTNANAHVLSDAMTITPGWSVGWFFVPLANLVMPYQGVKETWWASHESAGLHGEAETPLLGWWWGLWLATNILSNVSVMFGGATDNPFEGSIYIDLLGAALNVPLCLVLIKLIQRLTRVQLVAREGGVFS